MLAGYGKINHSASVSINCHILLCKEKITHFSTVQNMTNIRQIVMKIITNHAY